VSLPLDTLSLRVPAPSGYIPDTWQIENHAIHHPLPLLEVNVERHAENHKVLDVRILSCSAYHLTNSKHRDLNTMSQSNSKTQRAETIADIIHIGHDITVLSRVSRPRLSPPVDPPRKNPRSHPLQH
jgi:hypothetical protein